MKHEPPKAMPLLTQWLMLRTGWSLAWTGHITPQLLWRLCALTDDLELVTASFRAADGGRRVPDAKPGLPGVASDSQRDSGRPRGEGFNPSFFEL